MLADPLRLMDVCAVSDGAAALIVSSVAYASRIGKASAPRVAAISTVTPSFASALVEMPDIATRSEEHTSELQSLMRNSYAVFCLKKTKDINDKPATTSHIE